MGRKVLLVDDELHITMIVARKLRSVGFEVDTADNGQDALAKARQMRPDIIVTDYQMPRMGGDEFARALRNTEETAGTPVIMLTARQFLLDDDLRSQTSIKEILPKPFSVTEIVDLIDRVLSADTSANQAA